MLLWIYKFVNGYLYVKFVSPFPEKMLNICAANGINFWRVSLKKNVLYFKISISDFKRLRRLKRNLKGKVHITKKVGFPFIIERNKYRYGMLVGAVLFLIMINFLSGFVWNINISGNETIPSQSLLQSLEELKITEGTKISSIDPQIARNQLLMNRKDISWAAFNIEGCRLTIDITETKQKDNKSKEPSNLVAAEDGVIKAVEVISGTTNVRVGDAVTKGDLLVSGVVEYKDLHTEFVRSRAKIIAETETTLRVEVPFKQIKTKQTGKNKNRKTLCFFGFKIPLYLGAVGENYRLQPKTQSQNTAKPYLPIKIVENNYYEIYESEIRITQDKAKQQAKNELEEMVKNYVSGGKIISQRVVVESNDNTLTMLAYVKCEKDIILEEKLLVNTRN